MRIRRFLGCSLSGSALLALIAGCSGGGSASSPAASLAVPQSQPASRAAAAVMSQAALRTSVLPPNVAIKSKPDHSGGFVSPGASSLGAVFISDGALGDIFVFNDAGKPEAIIAGLSQPQGLGTDLYGDVYVANTNLSQILEYGPNYKTVKKTLSDPGQYPVDVKYDAQTGVVGVTNIISTSGGPGSVSFYAKNATTPCVTVSSKTWARIYFGAFDASGNFFIDGEASSGAVLVGVVEGGCSAFGIVTLTTGNTINFPGGVQVTPSNQIAIADQLGDIIFTYNHPVGNALGNPVDVTPLSSSGDPVQFSLSRGAGSLWTADAELASAIKYSYPAGGSATMTIKGLLQPIGAAINPLLVP